METVAMMQVSMQWLRRLAAFRRVSRAFLPATFLLGCLSPLLTRAGDDALSPPGQFVDVGGYQLHIYCEGEGTPAVIMDVGLGGTSLEWLSVQRLVKNYTRACVYDRAGYGWSDPGVQPRTSSQIADELYLLLKNAAIAGPYVLVGHSFGGYTVQLFAARYAYVTAGVVLVDSSHPQQVERFLAPPIGLNTAPSHNAAMVSLSTPRLPAHMPEDVQPAALALMSTWKAQQAMVQEYLHFRDSEAEVRNGGALPAVPLVVLSRGRNDWHGDPERGVLAEKLWLTLQDELAERSPHSAHLIANRSGHHVHLEQPALVADAISMVLDFARVAAGAGPADGDSASTWLAFRDATWRSDRLHDVAEVYPSEPFAGFATASARYAGHVAGTARPGFQRIPYTTRLSFAE